MIASGVVVLTAHEKAKRRALIVRRARAIRKSEFMRELWARRLARDPDSVDDEGGAAQIDDVADLPDLG